jgi:GrpB-like predicted nucleotidyltransferase (UPF0157 family)
MLVAHDPLWPILAQAEASRILGRLGAPMRVEHVGSTAIPTIAAKPILDLLLVAPDFASLVAARPALEELSYKWRGQNGLSRRRYYVLDDPETGRRKIHLHGYAAGDPAIRRHLAFRDHLLARPGLAAEYEREKRRCAVLHAGDKSAYQACKGRWIDAVEVKALSALEAPEARIGPAGSAQ